MDGSGRDEEGRAKGMEGKNTAILYKPVIPTRSEANVSTHSGTLKSSTSAASSYLGLQAFSDESKDCTFSIASVQYTYTDH